MVDRGSDLQVRSWFSQIAGRGSEALQEHAWVVRPRSSLGGSRGGVPRGVMARLLALSHPRNSTRQVGCFIMAFRSAGGLQVVFVVSWWPSWPSSCAVAFFLRVAFRVVVKSCVRIRVAPMGPCQLADASLPANLHLRCSGSARSTLRPG